MEITVEQKIEILKIAGKDSDSKNNIKGKYQEYLDLIMRDLEPVIPGRQEENDCPRWIRFLRESTGDNENVIKQLQEFAGYTLQVPNNFGKFLVLAGKGLGKTTFCHAIARTLVRDDQRCSVFGVNDFKSEREVVQLRDKAVNVSELRTKDLIGSDLRNVIKAICIGESIFGAPKYQDPFPFVPSCKLIFTTRDIFADEFSHGVGGRMLLVRFDQQPPEVDPFLLEKLEAEKVGIFRWAEAGLRRLIRQGRFTELKRVNNSREGQA